MERENWKEHGAIEKMQSILRIGIIVLAIVVVLMLVAGTVLRFIGVNWAAYGELLAMVVFWFYMLGVANGSFEDMHIGNGLCDALVRAPKVKHMLGLIKWSVVTVCGLGLLGWGIMLCIASVKQGMATPIYDVPMIIGYIAMVLGTGISSVFHVLTLTEYVRSYIETYVRKEVAE